MRKINFAFTILLGLCMAISCNNQGKPQQTTLESTGNRQENKNYSDDEYDEKSMEENIAPEVDPNGYKWLEGVWAASDDYGNFARMIITDTYMQIVNSNWNDLSDKVEDQTKQEYSIETRYNDILDKDILCMNDFVGVDVANHCPYVVLGEYSSLSLNRIDGQTTESAITKANLPTTIGIHGITDPVSYTWVDENLKGKVKSYMETALGWRVKKGFDEEGKLVTYTRKPGTKLDCCNYPYKDVYPVGMPIQDRRTRSFDCRSFYPYNNGYSGGFYYLLEHNFLNPVLMLGVGGPSSDSYKFKYDVMGHLTEIKGDNNNLLYTCEYDNKGRLIKRLVNDQPLIQIMWDESNGSDRPSFCIRHYSEGGGDLGENKYWWSSPDILVCKGGDVQFTFYKYPQVKTIKSKGVSACYYYDSYGRLIRCVVINPKSMERGSYIVIL